MDHLVSYPLSMRANANDVSVFAMVNDIGSSDSGITEDKSMKGLAFLLFSMGMVIAPHVGYVFQIQEMYTTGDTEGYSPLVSVILLASNSARILYFVGKVFAFPLLLQSILGVIVHTILLVVVLQIVEVRLMSLGGASLREEGLSNPDPIAPDGAEVIVEVRGLWSTIMVWLDSKACSLENVVLRLAPSKFLRYYVIWAVAGSIIVLSYYAVIGSFWSDAPEVVGFISLGTEALLVLPQILRNHRRRSTAGLTKMLLLTWVLGDVIKVIYFIVAGQPLPFTICGFFQIGLDVVVVAQTIYYRRINVGGSTSAASGVLPTPMVLGKATSSSVRSGDSENNCKSGR